MYLNFEQKSEYSPNHVMLTEKMGFTLYSNYKSVYDLHSLSMPLAFFLLLLVNLVLIIHRLCFPVGLTAFLLELYQIRNERNLVGKSRTFMYIFYSRNFRGVLSQAEGPGGCLHSSRITNALE